jgi:hypothetical protein
MNTEFCWGNLLRNVHLEDQEGNGKKLKTQNILGRYVLGVGWMQLTIMSNGGLSY